jgi:hypothetical protein
MSDKLTNALNFLKMGIAIIPLRHRGKEPEASLIGGRWGQYNTQLPTEYDLLKWLGSGWLNYAVIAGWQNLVIIDFDTMDYYNIWQLWGSMQDGDVQNVVNNSFRVRTRHGMHVYVVTESKADNGKRIVNSGGIDVQAQGRFVVGPGCVHPSGAMYEPENEFALVRVPSVESILPLDLFPRVAATCKYVQTNTSHITIQTQGVYDAYSVVNSTGMDLISKVKNTVRIENFFSNLTRTSADGRWYSVVCPFHQDTRPSGWIDARRQLFGCQVCGMKPMDVINLYARQHNIYESVAVSQLAKEVGIWG